MTRSIYAVLAFLEIAFVAGIGGCGGGSGSALSSLSISPSSIPDGTVGALYSQTFQAVGGSAPYAWHLNSGALPHNLTLGSSTTSTVVLSGTPDKQQSGVEFTIEVSDASHHIATQTFTINIANPQGPAINGSVTPPEGIVTNSYLFTFAATGGLQPLSWSSTGGVPPGLALASNGTLSGTPTTLGAFQMGVTVTDSAGQMNSATFSVTVVATGAANAALHGQYAFLFQGVKGGQGYVAAGSFVADGNGGITSGLIDANGVAGSNLSNTSFTGSYSFETINQGQLEIKNAEAGLDTVFHFAIAGTQGASADSGMMIGFDNVTRGAGVFAAQDIPALSNSSITGDYAFGAAGINTAGGRGAVAGRFTSDGLGGLNGGAMDVNESGTNFSNTGFTGTYSVVTSLVGRGSAKLNATLEGMPTTMDFTFYAVSPTQLYLVGSDAVSADLPLFSGVATQQSNGPFTNASMAKTSVFSASGLAPSDEADRSIGLIAMDGTGGFALMGDETDAGTILSNSFSGTYNVASNGRVTLTGAGNLAVLYLADNADGFMIGTDGHVTFGSFQVQIKEGNSLTTLAGTLAFATTSQAAKRNFNVAGTMTFSNGSFAGIQGQDLNFDGGVSDHFPLSGTYTIASNGRGAISFPEFTPYGDNVLYMVGTNSFVMLGSIDPTDTLSILYNATCSQRSSAGFGVCLP